MRSLLTKRAGKLIRLMLKPVKVSADVYDLCKKAYYYSQNSDESFDMTIGPITGLWRIGFPDAHKPT